MEGKLVREVLEIMNKDYDIMLIYLANVKDYYNVICYINKDEEHKQYLNEFLDYKVVVYTKYINENNERIIEIGIVDR